MKTIVEEFDVVVCGGGLAGYCAAVAAARHGARTCLVQDRPVFGGNSSSEVRVTPHGAAAFHAYARETGILSELLIEERSRNHEPILENGWTNSVWDLVMYDVAAQTPNLTFYVNTSVVGVKMADGETHTASAAPSHERVMLHRAAQNRGDRITGIVAHVANAEIERQISASYFIDCTGDGVVADLAGCEWRMGSEGRAEFNEPHAPEKANRDTMGNSIHFKAKKVGRPAPFVRPSWAVEHVDPAYFYHQGRVPKTVEGGYWWLEIGVPWDTIHEAEEIRHELTRHTLGVWDWIKNRDEKLRDVSREYALDWIGQVPGKRESRRIIGRHFMTEWDVIEKRSFADEIAFGGWFVDLHTPGGLLAPTSEGASAEGYAPDSEYAIKSYVGPYGIPLAICRSKDVGNLLMAGRNVSVTHAALGTVRVMATTALMGQAVGTAAALAIRHPDGGGDVIGQCVDRVQQALLRDGCFLPGVKNEDAHDLARKARVSASSEAALEGADPDAPAFHEGLTLWKDQVHDTAADQLFHRRGQWIAAGQDRIESLSVLLSNSTEKTETVEAWLVQVENIWDYRVEGEATISHVTLEVPPGEKQWVRWPVCADVRPGSYVRLDLAANPNLRWHAASGIVPGHVSAFEMARGRMRRYGSGLTMSFRVEPPQHCFAAGNVTSGVTRPHRSTNLWMSDPKERMPQWVELRWDDVQTIRTVELTFAGHLVREYHAYGPFYRDPQCVKDYAIAILAGGKWVTVLEVKDNYQRQRRHDLGAEVRTDALRLVVHATNGDPSAAVYEIRCYQAASN